MAVQIKLTIKGQEMPQTVTYQVSRGLLNTGFKFSFIAPVVLEERLMAIMKTAGFSGQSKIDSLEEVILGLCEREIKIETDAYELYFNGKYSDARDISRS